MQKIIVPKIMLIGLLAWLLACPVQAKDLMNPVSTPPAGPQDERCATQLDTMREGSKNPEEKRCPVLKDEFDGEIVAILTVGPDGSVTDAEITKSSPLLPNESAKKVLMKYRFKPDGRVHRAEIAIGINTTKAQ